LALALIALAALTWTALTTGVGVAAAAGAGVAHPPARAGLVVYLGVRLDESEVNDPVIAADLEQMRATAVVDAQTAAADPLGVQRLVQRGVDVEDGGHGNQRGLGRRASRLLWTRADQDVRAARLLDSLTGRPIKVFVPGRRINAWDIHDTHDAHLLVVVPDTTLVADQRGVSRVPPLQARQIYLVNGEGASNAKLAALLATLEQRLRVGGLTGTPLDALT
jgi:hypothetical protein